MEAVEFDTLFNTGIAVNAIISAALAVSTRNSGMSSHWIWRISHTLMLLAQIRVMNFLGAPLGDHDPSGISAFPTQFGLLFWILAVSVALVALSLPPTSRPGATRGRRYSWRGAVLMALTLACVGLSAYGTVLLLQEPNLPGFSDYVT